MPRTGSDDPEAVLAARGVGGADRVSAHRLGDGQPLLGGASHRAGEPSARRRVTAACRPTNGSTTSTGQSDPKGERGARREE